MKIVPVEKSKFNKLDLEFLPILEENELFEKAIRGIRKAVGLPDVGFKAEYTTEGEIKILNFHSDTNQIIDKASSLLNKPIKDLIHAFSLPISWWGTLFSIIILNIATPPLREGKWNEPLEIKYIGGLSTIDSKLRGNLEHPNELEPHIEIEIREGMSFAQLIDGLLKQKPVIERYLNYLHSVPDVSRLKDVDIKKEIIKLEKEGKSDPEIADYLFSKYGNSLPFDPDHNTINKYKNRFKNLVKKYPTNKYYLFYLTPYLK